jgi:1,4-alpha-glucan branching enzyme
MGEEFGADSPFLFFCDFKGELAAAVTNGRRSEFARFSKFRSAELRDHIPDPNAERTFLQSKLDWDSLRSEDHAKWLHFYCDLLSIRQRVIVPHLRGVSKARISSCDDQQGIVSMDWEFADGALLELRANLGHERLMTIMPQFGKQFYRSRSEEPGTSEAAGMAPWSVTWSLRS